MQITWHSNANNFSYCQSVRVQIVTNLSNCVRCTYFSYTLMNKNTVDITIASRWATE